MDLSVTSRDEGNRTVVVVSGEIDVYTAPMLREKLVSLIAKERYHLVVDMAKVSFLDSTGLGVFVGCMKRLRTHDGSLRLVCLESRIVKVFTITGLTQVFPIYDTLAEALAA